MIRALTSMSVALALLLVSSPSLFAQKAKTVPVSVKEEIPFVEAIGWEGTNCTDKDVEAFRQLDPNPTPGKYGCDGCDRVANICVKSTSPAKIRKVLEAEAQASLKALGEMDFSSPACKAAIAAQIDRKVSAIVEASKLSVTYAEPRSNFKAFRSTCSDQCAPALKSVRGYIDKSYGETGIAKESLPELKSMLKAHYKLPPCDLRLDELVEEKFKELACVGTVKSAQRWLADNYKQPTVSPVEKRSIGRTLLKHYKACGPELSKAVEDYFQAMLQISVMVEVIAEKDVIPQVECAGTDQQVPGKSSNGAGNGQVGSIGNGNSAGQKEGGGLAGLFPAGTPDGKGPLSCQKIPNSPGLITFDAQGVCQLNHNLLLGHFETAFKDNINKSFEFLNTLPAFAGIQVNGDSAKMCTKEHLTGTENRPQPDRSGTQTYPVGKCDPDSLCLNSSEILNALMKPQDELDESWSQSGSDFVESKTCSAQAIANLVSLGLISEGEASDGKRCSDFALSYQKGELRKNQARTVGVEIIPALVSALEDFERANPQELYYKHVPTSIALPGLNRKICLAGMSYTGAGAAVVNQSLADGSKALNEQGEKDAVNMANRNHGIIKTLDNWTLGSVARTPDQVKQMDCVNIPARLVRQAMRNDPCGGIDKIREYISTGLRDYETGKNAASVGVNVALSLIPGGAIVSRGVACLQSVAETTFELQDSMRATRQVNLEEFVRAKLPAEDQRKFNQAQADLKAAQKKMQDEIISQMTDEEKARILENDPGKAEMAWQLGKSCAAAMLTISSYARVARLGARVVNASKSVRVLGNRYVNKILEKAVTNPARTGQIFDIMATRQIDAEQVLNLAEDMVTDRLARKYNTGQPYGPEAEALKRLRQFQKDLRRAGQNRAGIQRQVLLYLGENDRMYDEFIANLARKPIQEIRAVAQKVRAKYVEKPDQTTGAGNTSRGSPTEAKVRPDTSVTIAETENVYRTPSVPFDREAFNRGGSTVFFRGIRLKEGQVFQPSFASKTNGGQMVSRNPDDALHYGIIPAGVFDGSLALTDEINIAVFTGKKELINNDPYPEDPKMNHVILGAEVDLGKQPGYVVFKEKIANLQTQEQRNAFMRKIYDYSRSLETPGKTVSGQRQNPPPTPVVPSQKAPGEATLEDLGAIQTKMKTASGAELERLKVEDARIRIEVAGKLLGRKLTPFESRIILSAHNLRKESDPLRRKVEVLSAAFETDERRLLFEAGIVDRK